MDLANIRSLGMRAVDVYCVCAHHEDARPD